MEGARNNRSEQGCECDINYGRDNNENFRVFIIVIFHAQEKELGETKKMQLISAWYLIPLQNYSHFKIGNMSLEALLFSIVMKCDQLP